MALERVLQLEEDSRLKVRRVSAPAQQPVTRTEVAQHLNLDADQEQADGPLLDRLIKAATSWCEEYLNRQLITATWANFYNIFDEPLKVYYAILMKIASMYEDRRAGKETAVTAAENLLRPHQVKLF